MKKILNLDSKLISALHNEMFKVDSKFHSVFYGKFSKYDSKFKFETTFNSDHDKFSKLET